MEDNILQSVRCGVGIDLNNKNGILRFEGTLQDQNGNIIKEKEQYCITIPIEEWKNVIAIMISQGLEYQKETNEQIGFPDNQ